MEILTSGKLRYQLRSLLCWTEKIHELWSTNNDG